MKLWPSKVLDFDIVIVLLSEVGLSFMLDEKDIL